MLTQVITEFPKAANRYFQFAAGARRTCPRGNHPSDPNVPYKAGLNDRSAARAASSNCSSSCELTPRRPATTFRANSTYSTLRLTDQSEGGLAAIARKLLVLSASLSILALGLLIDAVSICMSFLFALGRLLSSVTSTTIDATSSPNVSA